mmetsp:Transcript_18790/g.59908  ORF Transcript_18790/g.59908 Transcript_18790/m.59908 type:complete len:273 (-) Transcript_18790:192-1010(-)
MVGPRLAPRLHAVRGIQFTPKYPPRARPFPKAWILFRVRMGSPVMPCWTAVSWSVVTISQRAVSLTPRNRTPPTSTSAHWSSSNAGTSPSTTILGRNRFIGTGASSSLFSCWRLARDAIMRGNPSANETRSFLPSTNSSSRPLEHPSPWYTKRSPSDSSTRHSQAATASPWSMAPGILDRHTRTSRVSTFVSAACTTSTETGSTPGKVRVRRVILPSPPSASWGRMRAMRGWERCEMKLPSSLTTMKRRSCLRPSRSTIAQLTRRPAQDFTG